MAERRESVRLELNDAGFSSGMAKAAAATMLLNRELSSLSRRSTTSIGKVDELAKSTSALRKEFDGFPAVDLSGGLHSVSRSARDADTSINQLTGRLRLFADAAAILGPSLAPVGGVLIAGIGGMANQMGFAAVAGGVLIGSLQGVGDALGAMNDASLDPSDSNLEKAEEALKRLSPAAREFAEAAFDLKPALLAMRDMGAESLIPGLTESLNDLERLAPQVGRIFEAVGGALGDIAADGAASLASDRWRGFFEFIEQEGPRVISELATTVGSLTHGLAELWQAFTPLNNGFSSWLMDVAAGFDSWATGLSATEGFKEFVDYIRETGPQVAETFGALANAVVQIVQAAAPLGGPVLAAIEAFADAIGAIADSNLGTPIMAGVAALALYNRALQTTMAVQKRVDAGGGLFGAIGARQKATQGSFAAVKADVESLASTWATAGARTAREQQRMSAAAASLRSNMGGLAKDVGRAAGPVAGMAVVASGAADGLGLTNTASLALMGSFAGPVGAAIGAGAGALLDLKAAGEGSTAAIQGLNAAAQSGDIDLLGQQIAAAKAELEDINNLDFGGDIFDRIGFQVADTFGGKSADESKAEIEAAEKALEELTKAQELGEIQSRASAVAYASQAGVWMTSAEWARESTESIKAQADAMIKARDAAYKTANSFVTLGDSLNDSKVTLGEWIAQMAKQADALRNFTNNARTAAKKGLDEGLIASLQDAGVEGALRMRQLSSATEGEIAKANAAWRKGQKAMEDYVNFKVPPKRVDLDINPAMRNIGALEARLRAIRDEDVLINVRQIGSTTLGPRPGVATGGHITGPGTGTSDSIPAYLSNGEFVIRAAAVQKYGVDTFHSLNAMHFATGGSVDRKGDKRKVGASFFAADNTAALQAAIDRLTMVAQDQTAAVEDQTRRTDEWAQRMEAVARATVSGFDTGLFERDSNVWAAGAGGGPLANLTRDIAGLQERGALQSQLAGMGLSGDALAALLGQGSNSDISSLIQSGQVSQYAALFNQRAALQGSVGAAAGQLAFGAEFKDQSKALREATRAQGETQMSILRMETQLARTQAALERMERNAPERTGAEVGRVINGAASSGQRDRRNRTGVGRG